MSTIVEKHYTPADLLVMPDAVCFERTAHIHRADGSAGWLREDDELSGEDVLPGFSVPVSSLFPNKPSTAN
jgi:hypothetical protein